MNSIQANPERVEIRDEKSFNPILYLWISFLVFINPCLLTILILSTIENPDIPNYLLIMIILIPLDVGFSHEIKAHFEENTPKQNVRFSISNEKIEVYIQERLFTEMFWQSIKTIEVVKERYSISPYDFFSKGFKLTFKGPILNKVLRLYVLVYKKEKSGLILTSLEKFADINNTEYLFIPNVRKADNKAALDDYMKIRQFRKSLKDIKKPKKYSAYQRHFRKIT